MYFDFFLFFFYYATGLIVSVKRRTLRSRARPQSSSFSCHSFISILTYFFIVFLLLRLLLWGTHVFAASYYSRAPGENDVHRLAIMLYATYGRETGETTAAAVEDITKRRIVCGTTCMSACPPPHDQRRAQMSPAACAHEARRRVPSPTKYYGGRSTAAATAHRLLTALISSVPEPITFSRVRCSPRRCCPPVGRA